MKQQFGETRGAIYGHAAACAAGHASEKGLYVSNLPLTPS